MLPEEMPKCVCGYQEWKPGGASLGTGMCQQWFTCDVCLRPATVLSANHQSAIFLPAKTPMKGWASAYEKEHPFPEDGIEWINKVVLVTWRARGEQVEKFQQEFLNQHLLRICAEKGLPLATHYKEVPEDRLEEWRATYRDVREQICMKSDEWWKGGFAEPCLPANLPESLEMYVDWNGWQRVTHEQTQNLEVPPDPIRVRHDAYWNEVFSRLQMATGIVIERSEIKNEYCGAENEPWYTFTHNDTVFKVGPRKRVDSIKVSAPHGIGTERINAMAKEANTSFWADGHWQPGLGAYPVAKELEVHSWTKENTVLYLQTLLGDTRPKTKIVYV